MKIRSSILIFSFFLLAACEKEDSSLQFGSSGVVVDAETMEPVDSAIVTMFAPASIHSEIAQQVITNKDGHFAFEGANENFERNQLSISKAPYYATTNKISFKPKNATYLLHPASLLKLVPRINNPDEKVWTVSARILKTGHFNPIQQFGGSQDIDHHYCTITGNQDLKLAIDLYVEHQVQERDTFGINIPYRDTLVFEYIKSI